MRFVVSDTAAHILNTWNPVQQNLTHVSYKDLIRIVTHNILKPKIPYIHDNKRVKVRQFRVENLGGCNCGLNRNTKNISKTHKSGKNI